MQTNSPHKLDTSKKFIFSPFQKQFRLPLNKTKKIYCLPISKTISTPPKQNKQDSQVSFISLHFCHILTKTTQIKSKQKTYATNVKRK